MLTPVLSVGNGVSNKTEYLIMNMDTGGTKLIEPGHVYEIILDKQSKTEEYDKISERNNIKENIHKLEAEIRRLKPLGCGTTMDIITQKQIAISNLYIDLSRLE